jgi:LysM repeat protein
VLSIKSGETTTMNSMAHEFDFTKTVHVQGLSAEDTVFGSVAVAGVTVKADNKVKPELNAEIDIAFSGFVLSARDVEYVADAFSFDNALNFTTSSVEHTNALPQANQVVDIEGNMTMPANSPYIARILTSSGAHITGVNIGCADGKVTVEGVVSATVVYECEEKQIHSHDVQVAFNTSVRVEGIGSTFNIQASVGVVTCYIKARRGKELMVDAKLAVSISAAETNTRDMTAEITLGEAKQCDDSAIVIVMPEQGETLWDIAKRIGMPVADIVKQNPNCSQGVNTGDRIFIYRQQVINF